MKLKKKKKKIFDFFFYFFFLFLFFIFFFFGKKSLVGSVGEPETQHFFFWPNGILQIFFFSFNFWQNICFAEIGT